MRKTYKGLYKPINPTKYKGDPNNIVFRSLWEKQVMVYLDKNPNVVYWGSEEIPIPYLSPKDGKMHRYFPDFVVVAKSSDGKVKTLLLEVKPYKETQPPKKGKRTTQKYLEESMTYGINMAKFDAARDFCSQHNWEFKIITEYELGKKKPRHG